MTDAAVPPPAPAEGGRVPITVLAGFLGAGKTTLLNRILAGDHGRRIAVLVNDFGAINVDSMLVVSRDAEVIALENGCICCSVKGDLVQRLTALLEGAAPPEHVLVETSGVADPGRLLVALRDPHLRRLSRVDGVVTLVDAAGAGDIPPRHRELARRQIAAADIVVLSKADLVPDKRVAELRAWLGHPRVRVVASQGGDVPLDVLLGAGEERSEGGRRFSGGEPGHDALFATWAWTASSPLSLERVRALLGALPEHVYRAKGVLDVDAAPGARVVAHVVGRRVELRPEGSWDAQGPRSQLVFVSLDPDAGAGGLRVALDACVLAPPPGGAYRAPDAAGEGLPGRVQRPRSAGTIVLARGAV